MAKKLSFKDAPYDKVNSTYTQSVAFVNRKIIPGYSKKVGFPESVDHIHSLTNFILRMYRDEYLRPSSRIDPVAQITYEHNQAPYGWICTCRYEDFDLSPKWLTEKRFVDWLLAFYDAIEQKRDLSYIMDRFYRRGRVNDVHELDANNFGFARPDQLIKHVVRLIESGKYPIEACVHFYTQCREKYFERENMEGYNEVILNMANKFAEV